MHLAQLVLVIVMIRRAENDTAQTTLRHKRVRALGRLGGRAFGLVERGEMFQQHMRDDLLLAQPQRFIQRANKQRLHRLAPGILLHRKPDRVTLRLLQNQPRDVKQRIRPARHLDLPRQGLDALLVRHQRRVDFRQRQRCRSRALLVTVIAPRAAVPIPLRASGAAIPTGAAGPTRGAIPARTAKTTTAATATAFAACSRRTGRATAVIAITIGSVVAAREFCVAVDGRVSLRPGGQEQFFEIKVRFRIGIHK